MVLKCSLIQLKYNFDDRYSSVVDDEDGAARKSINERETSPLCTAIVDLPH
jgi:hypothetical protein